MADELDVTLTLAGSETENLAAWRAEPPDWLSQAGYELADESFESLVFEADVTTRATRILMWGMATTVYRISATFRPDGRGATRLTLQGQARDATREAMLAWADQRAMA